MLFVIATACADDQTPSAAPRAECEPFPQTAFFEDLDEGPCALESSSDEDDPWTLVAQWDGNPREGTPGDGPCIHMQLAGADGAGGGAGWCDLPEARLIGEWHSRELGPSRLAWGPTSAGRIEEVQIEFADGSPVAITPKATPWEEFDYWFATYSTDRRPSALVALDDEGTEIAREDLPPYFPPGLPQ